METGTPKACAETSQIAISKALRAVMDTVPAPIRIAVELVDVLSYPAGILTAPSLREDRDRAANGVLLAFKRCFSNAGNALVGAQAMKMRFVR